MNLSWFKPFLRKTQQFAVKNAPGILMGMGTVGSITSVIFAIKATPAAWNAHADAVVEKTAKKIGKTAAETEWLITIDETEQEKLTIPETIKACGKFYIPAIGLELFSLGCFWGAHGIDVRRQAILAGLYSTAEEALREYQRKVQEMIGKDAEKEVRNAQAQDFVTQNPPPAQKTVILEDDTDLWWVVDGHYFRSNLMKIKAAQNDINHDMIQNMYASRADLYWLLDPEGKYIKPSGEDGQIGWSVDKLLVLEHDWGDGPDGKPVGIIRYTDKDGLEYPPQPGFSRMC